MKGIKHLNKRCTRMTAETWMQLGRPADGDTIDRQDYPLGKAMIFDVRPRYSFEADLVGKDVLHEVDLWVNEVDTQDIMR